MGLWWSRALFRWIVVILFGLCLGHLCVVFLIRYLTLQQQQIGSLFLVLLGVCVVWEWDFTKHFILHPQRCIVFVSIVCFSHSWRFSVLCQTSSSHARLLYQLCEACLGFQHWACWIVACCLFNELANYLMLSHTCSSSGSAFGNVHCLDEQNLWCSQSVSFLWLSLRFCDTDDVLVRNKHGVHVFHAVITTSVPMGLQKLMFSIPLVHRAPHHAHVDCAGRHALAFLDLHAMGVECLTAFLFVVQVNPICALGMFRLWHRR